MHTFRLLLLYLVVLFAAYSEYQAEKIVKQIKADEAKHMQYKNGFKHPNGDFIKSDSLNTSLQLSQEGNAKQL